MAPYNPIYRNKALTNRCSIDWLIPSSEEFRENLKKIGPDSKFWYRSRLDPLSEDEYRALCRKDREEWRDAQTGNA